MVHDAGKQVALGRVLVALSALAWSTAGIFTKGVEADVWTVLLWRGLLAGGVMSAWLVWRRGQAGLADWKHLGWAGWSAATVSSAATICFIAAFKNTAVANVAIIYATAPFAAAAIAWIWMRETPGLATLAAAGLCLAGVTVMVGGSAGSPDLIGDLLALGMTALMALMMVIMRRHPDRPMTLAVGPVSCLQLVAIGWVMGAQLDVSARELVLLVGFGVVHAAATVLLAEGVLRLRAAEAALLGALEVRGWRVPPPDGGRLRYRAPLRQVLHKLGHLALHEGVEHRHRERSLSMTLAPHHALVDETLAHGGDGDGPNAQGLRDPAGGTGSRTQLGHGPEILLLKGRQSIETDPEEILVEVRDHLRRCVSDHAASDWTRRCRVPDLISPLLNEVGEVLRGGQYLLHRAVVERHALGSGRLHERQSGIAAFQRPDFRIVEQPFRIGLGLAGQCRHLRQPRTDEHKFNSVNGKSVNSVKSVKPACLRLG